MRKVFHFICIFLPYIVSQIFLVIYAYLCRFIIVALSNAGILQLAPEQLNRCLEYVYYLTGPLLSMVICVFFFRRFLPAKKSGEFRLSFLNVVLLFTLGILLQYLTSFILTGLAAFFPQTFQIYSEHLTEIGVTDPTRLDIIYTVIIAPIYEESIFRSMTAGIACSVFPFWAANLIQALIFGIVHMNLVQGIYAFILGLCLGAIWRRYHSILPTILVHFFINLSGMFLIPQTLGGTLILLIILLILFPVLLKIQKKRKPDQYLWRRAEHETEKKRKK